MKIKLPLFFLFLFYLHSSFAAEKDSLKTKSSNSYSSSKAPSIGYSLGYLNYFGDVKLDGYQPSFSLRLGHQFYISKPLSNSLALSANFLAGKIYGEETRGTDNLNFKSSLFGQSLMLEYNFHHLIKPSPESKFSVLPVLGLGVEALIFRAKSDMQNANGKTYYYWTDGSIKDLPELSQNMDNAVVIERDYSYETELRDANLDGFGKYSQITFALPVMLAADMKVGQNFGFRLGATFHYTFSDMLDNLSSAGSGNRQGNAGNDMVLVSSFGVNYKFGEPRPKKEKPIDTDEDGIADLFDKCRDTPKGVKVDKQGCPIVNEKDHDGDGVLDVVDKCRDTKPGAAVDKQGCSEEQKADADGDGIANYLDKCADTPADSKVDANGCPVKEKKPVEVVDKAKEGDFYFADLNKNGRVEISEVNEFIDRLFDGDKNVTISTMDEIIDYYFSQDDTDAEDEKKINMEKIPVQKSAPEEVKGKAEAEIKPVDEKAKPPVEEVAPEKVKGDMETEKRPVEAKGKLVKELKPLETKDMDSKYHFADLNKNGKIEKEELDVFIERMNKGDKSVPITLIDEILIYYFDQK